MTHKLPYHVSYGRLGDRAIALDLLADRYFLLGADQADALHKLEMGRDNPISSSALASLVANGLLSADQGKPVQPVSAPAVRLSAIEVDAIAPTPVRSIEIAWRRVWVELLLYGLGLQGTLGKWQRWRLAGSMSAPSHDRALAIAQAYAEARVLVPGKRHCVVNSLILLSLLWRRGAAADLYFGVHLDPFAAHCWVQIDDIVLTDPVDVVAEFTPVFQL